VLPSGVSAIGTNCAAGETVDRCGKCTISKEEHTCNVATCGSNGSWNSPKCIPWKLQYQFMCATKGSRCDSYWGETEMAARGYNFTPRNYGNNCGEASKMLFLATPYDDTYDATYKGYQMQSTGYENGSPKTGTTHNPPYTAPKKYAPEVDESKFIDFSWLEGSCSANAPSCMAGLNYDVGKNMCADSASGWNDATPASRCGYVKQKCEEFKIYYWHNKQSARLPLTPHNQAKYQSWAHLAYMYKYSFKKSMECTANNVTRNSNSSAAVPDGWNCKVDKRCVCISCTMGSTTDQPGEPNYTGEPCSCSNIPAPVQGMAGGQCAQT